MLAPDGHMMALLTAKERQGGDTDAERAALFRSMMAYTGRYRIEGERFITKVDACWNEAWTDSEQERFYTLEGNRLDIVSAWAPAALFPGTPMARGILSWVREAP